MDVGNNIKAIREAKRIKQVEISELLGVDNSYYARQEKRGNKLTVEQIEKIAGALGVSVVELLTGERERVEPSEREKQLERENAELKELKDQNRELISTLRRALDYFRDAFEYTNGEIEEMKATRGELSFTQFAKDTKEYYYKLPSKDFEKYLNATVSGIEQAEIEFKANRESKSKTL